MSDKKVTAVSALRAAFQEAQDSVQTDGARVALGYAQKTALQVLKKKNEVERTLKAEQKQAGTAAALIFDEEKANKFAAKETAAVRQNWRQALAMTSAAIASEPDANETQKTFDDLSTGLKAATKGKIALKVIRKSA